MKRILIMLAMLTGCAYGVSPSEEEQPVYGHTQGPGRGDSDAGSYQDPGSGVPFGCYVETIKVEGQLPMFFTFCPVSMEPAFKWLVDPPPDTPSPNGVKP